MEEGEMTAGEWRVEEEAGGARLQLMHLLVWVGIQVPPATK